jgi:hypothetical protein
MPYDRSRDPITNASLALPQADRAGFARNWYALQAADIGAQELPRYGRALRVRIGSGGSTVTLVVVPVGETSDAATRTLVVDATETLAFGVRRVVSVNGGTSIPANTAIDVITD